MYNMHIPVYNTNFIFQKAAFALEILKLKTFAMANVASIDTREALLKHFSALR